MMQIRPRINGFTLKMIALLTMLTDHIGAVLFPQMIILRCIGRISFPIYAFLLVEGFIHTRDVRKYSLRLLLFALLSEIPFDMAFFGKALYWQHQNIFFTLFLGVLMLAMIQKFSFQPAAQILSAATCIAAAFVFRVDYSGIGVILILALWYFRAHPVKRLAAFVLLLVLGYGTGIESWALLSYVPIALYNGRRGPSMKYVFYIFYPAHLIVLVLLQEILSKFR